VQIVENIMSRWIFGWREENSSELKRQVEISILNGKEVAWFYLTDTKTPPYNFKYPLLPIHLPMRMSLGFI
jgi:hypothetical protein